MTFTASLEAVAAEATVAAGTAGLADGAGSTGGITGVVGEAGTTLWLELEDDAVDCEVAVEEAEELDACLTSAFG